MSTETLTVTTPSDREIVMTRHFNAPRSLVFDCLTKPELLKRWGLGPRPWTLTVCEIDLRVGGSWRFVMSRGDGPEMIMRGTYREIAPPERIVQTEIFEPRWYEGEAVNTTTLTEENGKTRLTITVLYDSKEIRDAVLKTGMARGASEGYDRLAELLPLFTAEMAEA